MITNNCDICSKCKKLAIFHAESKLGFCTVCAPHINDDGSCDDFEEDENKKSRA